MVYGVFWPGFNRHAAVARDAVKHFRWRCHTSVYKRTQIERERAKEREMSTQMILLLCLGIGAASHLLQLAAMLAGRAGDAAGGSLSNRTPG